MPYVGVATDCYDFSLLAENGAPMPLQSVQMVNPTSLKIEFNRTPASGPGFLDQYKDKVALT